MATIDTTISTIGVLEHHMARCDIIHLGGVHLALLALFDEKRNETTLERVNDILEFWLYAHNNFKFRFRFRFEIKKLLLERSSRLRSQELHEVQENDLAMQ